MFSCSCYTKHLHFILNITSFEQTGPNTSIPSSSSSSSPFELFITSSINSSSVNKVASLIQFLFAKMIYQAAAPGWQKSSSFFYLILKIFEAIIVIRLGKFLLLFQNSCFCKPLFAKSNQAFSLHLKLKKPGIYSPIDSCDQLLQC